MGPFTAAEIYQMYVERMRQEWQHTCFIAAYIIEVNRDKKKGKPVNPADLNPMEDGGRKTSKHSTPLNSEEGFLALRSVAQTWRPGRAR